MTPRGTVITEDFRDLQSSGFSRPSNAWIVLMSPVGAMERLPASARLGASDYLRRRRPLCLGRRSARSSAEMTVSINEHARRRRWRAQGTGRWIAAEVGLLKFFAVWRTEVRPPAARLPQDVHFEAAKRRVVGNERHVLYQSLCREHTVEWVLVWARKSPCELRVRDAERQLLPAVFADHLIEALGEPRRTPELGS